ncbi:MAG: hypothetical protein Q9216_006945 [Gyalolechia sp. 2 TL-2023]
MAEQQLSEYVTLISNDGFEFVVKRDAANVAGTIRKIGMVMEKLSEYLYYNLKHKEAKHVPDMELPPALVLELLVAADFFDGELYRWSLLALENQWRRS